MSKSKFPPKLHIDLDNKIKTTSKVVIRTAHSKPTDYTTPYISLAEHEQIVFKLKEEIDNLHDDLAGESL